MNYRRLALSLILLGFAASGMAGMPAGHFGVGGNMAGSAHGHVSGGGHFGGGHHSGSQHFHGGPHFGGTHHHHSHVFVEGFIGAPLLFWPGYDYSAPYYAPPPQAYVSQDDPDPVWYYCVDSQAYYPYVKDCPAGWQAVPAAPPAP